jgi:hypothetical protein
MSAPAEDDVVVHGDAERGGDVDDRFRHLDVRTRRRGIAARMVVHQDDRSIACCTCLRQLMAPFGHGAMSELSLLSGVNRTSRLPSSTSGFDRLC